MLKNPMAREVLKQAATQVNQGVSALLNSRDSRARAASLLLSEYCDVIPVVIFDISTLRLGKL